jgi:hypothetical protein
MLDEGIYLRCVYHKDVKTDAGIEMHCMRWGDTDDICISGCIVFAADKSTVKKANSSHWWSSAPRPVICRATGEIYKSAAAASRALGLKDDHGVTSSIIRGHLCRGRKWEHMTEEEVKLYASKLR